METQEPIFYDGYPSNPVGVTPFGFFDADSEFQSDAPKAAEWVARKLGYPVVEVELIDKQIYACFEEAITVYGNQVNQFNAREYMLTLQGTSTANNATQRNVIGSSIPQLVRLAADYGTEAQSGGNVDVKKGYISASQGTQSYDLKTLWADVSESGKKIEIRRMYHYMPPAIARYYDPFATTGLGLTNLMAEFGFDGYSPPVTFVMMPAYEDLLRIQAIEINDMIRKSQYGFEIANNVVRFSPVFKESKVIWFDYMVVDDKRLDSNVFQSGSNVVSDLSNVPYDHVTYSKTNDMSRTWIFKYTLALAKELLGIIRSKFSEIPYPDGEIRMDGEILRREGIAEKEALVKELRETLEQTGQQAQMKKQMENSENMQKMFSNVPTLIYIG
jgi:hypothetical protein